VGAISAEIVINNNGTIQTEFMDCLIIMIQLIRCNFIDLGWTYWFIAGSLGSEEMLVDPKLSLKNNAWHIIKIYSHGWFHVPSYQA